jgi:hypothetical protein
MFKNENICSQSRPESDVGIGCYRGKHENDFMENLNSQVHQFQVENNHTGSFNVIIFPVFSHNNFYQIVFHS